jgi:solute carrier family 35 protein C2
MYHEIQDSLNEPSKLSNILYAASWFFFSSLLSIYNKALVGKNHYDFQYPLFLVATHQLTHFLLSSATIYFFPRFKVNQRFAVSKYFTTAFPAGLATAGDICLSTASLQLLSLSFYTMVKSSVPVWILMFAFWYGLEKPSARLIAIIMIICAGVMLSTSGDVEYSASGFFMVLFASISSGLRWSLTQILLQKSGASNPFATLRALSPTTGMVAFIVSCLIEFTGPNGIFKSIYLNSVFKFIEIMAVLLLGAVLAFCSDFY